VEGVQGHLGGRFSKGLCSQSSHHFPRMGLRKSKYQTKPNSVCPMENVCDVIRVRLHTNQKGHGADEFRKGRET
jgi:hypothetical protein